MTLVLVLSGTLDVSMQATHTKVALQKPTIKVISAVAQHAAAVGHSGPSKGILGAAALPAWVCKVPPSLPHDCQGTPAWLVLPIYSRKLGCA